MSCDPSAWQCNLTHCMSVSSISLLGLLKQHFEFSSSIIKRKCQWLYVKGWECKSPIATTMKLWILCQDRTSALSLLAELDVILQWSKWATCNMMSCHLVLWSAKPYLLNITCALDCVTLDDFVLHRCVRGGPGWRPRTNQQLACSCTRWDTSTRSIATGHRVSLCLTGVCERPETAVGHWCAQLVCSGNFCVSEESNSAIYFWHLYKFQNIVKAENKLQNYKNMCVENNFRIWHSEDLASWYILIVKAEIHYFSTLFW